MTRHHLQPVGIFPLPATCLLLPEVADDLGAAERLLSGELAGDTPAEWRFFAAAAAGDAEAALSLLAPGAGPVEVYNRFVLRPSPEAYADARGRLDGDLRTLLECAAFTAGVSDAPPAGEGLTDELYALAMATASAADLEAGRYGPAAEKLKQAAAAAVGSSPVFAATLLGQRADVLIEDPDASPALAMLDLRESLRLAEHCRLPMLRAELQVKQGMLLQQTAGGQRGALLQAVKCYQSALHDGLTEADQPELFAQVQCNLGLAYLSMPSDGEGAHLRAGIAVQAFRHALKVYDKESHPEMWARVSMNLANALQHAPSSHQQENLIQAVETYEEILGVRMRAKDPVEYARVLLNQANALAHLGIFKPALEKASEACKLFSWHDHEEESAAARDLAEQINQHWRPEAGAEAEASEVAAK